MIVIINGAFGVGKTSVAKMLVKNIPNSILYDPEEVGFMLRNIIPNEIMELEEKADKFQDLELWRKLVVNIAKELISKYNKNLIIPITLRKYEYLKNIYHGLQLIDNDIYHFCLNASIETIHKRLLNRGEKPGAWCFNQTIDCVETFKNSKFSEHIDTENLTLDEIVDNIIKRIEELSNNFIKEEYLSKREYLIKVKNVDLKLLNSSHQSITHIYKKKPYYEIKLQIHPLIIQQELDIYDLNKYTHVEKEIMDKEEIDKFIKSVIANEKDKYKIIEKTLNYTRKVRLNEDIAVKRFNTTNNINSIKSILEGEYSCSRCTNLFISIMRNLNIPSKFILGKTSNGSYHTWAEVFIEKVGWIPIETQIYIPTDVNKGYFGITNKHFKLYEGIDFDDIKKKHLKLVFEIKDIK